MCARTARAIRCKSGYPISHQAATDHFLDSPLFILKIKKPPAHFPLIGEQPLLVQLDHSPNWEMRCHGSSIFVIIKNIFYASKSERIISAG